MLIKFLCSLFVDRLRSVECRVRRETWQIINGRQVRSTLYCNLSILLCNFFKVRRSIVSSRDTNNHIIAGAIQNVRNGRYDTMAFLRRVAFTARSYLDHKIGPIPNDNLFPLPILCFHTKLLHYDWFIDIARDLEQVQPVLNLHPLPPPTQQLLVRGARRPRGGSQQMAPVAPRRGRPCGRGQLDNPHILGNNYNSKYKGQ